MAKKIEKVRVRIKVGKDDFCTIVCDLNDDEMTITKARQVVGQYLAEAFKEAKHPTPGYPKTA